MEIRATIDRVEGVLAILLLENEEKTINWPLRFLPKGIKEGDILRVNLSIDEKVTEEQREKIMGLIEKLKEKA